MCGLADSLGGSALIAVLDGDEALREALRFSLETEGYRVRAFGTAQALLDCAPGLGAACFVIDEAACDLRLDRLLCGRPVPVILLSSGQGAPSVRRLNARASVVDKPLMTDALSRRIATVLRASP